MRLVADLATVLTAASAVLGFMWRRHRIQRQSANLEHMKRLAQENEEMDAILDKMGANDGRTYGTGGGGGNGRDDRHRDGPERRGLRDSQRDH